MTRSKRITVLLAAAMAAAVAATAGLPGTDVFLPMVGRNPGVPPSVWYTSVWIYNPGDVVADVRFSFLERDKANSAPLYYDATLQPGETRCFEDAMIDLFGVNGWGAIRVYSPNAKVVVNERFFNQLPGAGGKGSQGQDFVGMPKAFAIGAGERTAVLGVYQTVPAADSDFRFNFGFVEVTGASAKVRVTPVDEGGTALAPAREYTISAYSQRQLAFKDHFPTVSTESARLAIEVVAGAGRVLAYGTGIANGSQDPTTFEMQLVEAQAVAFGITEVEAGDGLTGGGTTGKVTLNVGAGEGIAVESDRVSIEYGGVVNGMLADGAVTAAKIYANSVGREEISTDAVGADEIAAHAVGADEIADGAVGAAEIANGSVGKDEIANESITYSKLTDGAVAAGRLADNAVSTAKLVDGAVTDVKVATGIAYAKLSGAPASLPPSGPAGGSLAGTYPNPTLAADAVGAAQIASGAVGAAEIADGAVGGTELADGAVTDVKVATGIAYAKLSGAPASLPPSGAAGGSLAGTYPNPTLANASVGSHQIQEDAVSARNLVDGAVGAAAIADGAVGAAEIADGSVGNADLADGAVTDAKVATGVSYSKLKGAPTSLPPSGDAGGALSGTYPNPSLDRDSVGALQIAAGAVAASEIADGAVGNGELADGAVTDAKVASGIAYSKLSGAPTALPPSGAAGGDLTGTYPNPTIGLLAVTDAKVASGIAYAKLSGAPTALPPSGAAGGDLTGTYPSPTIKANAIGSAELANGSVSSDDVGFNYAGSASKGGAAADLACSACVTSSEISVTGSVAGRILRSNGSSVGWVDDSLKLPYYEELSNGVPGFWVVNSGSGSAIVGNATSGNGVFGIATASGGSGIYGQANSAGALAGSFLGNVAITGNLSKGGGSFKIDHPLAPADRYLYHSFVESPDMMNVYNGNVVLDGRGEAVVELPEWFEALNRDFRFQLTCIGGFAPIYVAEEVQGNRFRIAGGTSGLKVSWQVTGIRQDAWANTHRIPVEEDKPVRERGTYLHPAEHGQPETLSVQRALWPDLAAARSTDR